VSPSQLKQVVALHVSTQSSFRLIVDTAATRHFCCQREVMHNTHEEHGEVTSAGAGTQSFDTVGDITFTVGQHTITLTNVAFVPDFHVNLLSVPQLTRHGVILQLQENEAQLIHPSRNVRVVIPREGDLYILTPSSVHHSRNHSSSSSSAFQSQQ
jgi:hypothetical protein